MKSNIQVCPEKDHQVDHTQINGNVNLSKDIDLFNQPVPVKRPCERCGTSIEGYHGNAKYCKDCQPIVDNERRIKHFQEIRKQRKLTLREQAFEFLYTNKPFQDCMQGWIDFAIEHGANKINIAWVAWSVRQFGHLKFKNAYVVYFKDWICKNWPEYAKYFKGNNNPTTRKYRGVERYTESEPI